MAKKQRRFLIRNTTKSTVLAATGRMADTWLSRLRGLLLQRKIQQQQGLILSPCNSIHMFGMLYSIDAIFVDREQTVVGLVKGIWLMAVSPVFIKAHSCIELPSGTISATNTESGDRIDWEEQG